MPKKKIISNRCEGWTRHGGVFTLGPVTWSQCENEAVVNLTVIQDNEKTTQPICMDCWQNGIDLGIEIVSAVPLAPIK